MASRHRHRRTEPRRPGRPRAHAGGRPAVVDVRAAGDQLHGGAHPPRPLPAAARAARGARRRDRAASSTVGLASASSRGDGRRLRRAGRDRPPPALPAPARRGLVGGRVVPDGLPDRVDPADAASASSRPGARVLVTAAAGGVGSAAVQIVRRSRRAGRAAVGREEKHELPRSLGADPVTYDALGRARAGRRRLRPRRRRALRAEPALLKPLGTAIAVGFAGGLWQPLDTARLVGRNIGVHGLLPRPADALDPAAVRSAALDVLRLWEGGVVRPVVGARVPARAGRRGARLIESRKSTGKVVLIP